MAAPDFFVRSILRWTLAQGSQRDALEALVIAGAGGITASGEQLTGATANGKSFSFTIPPGMDALSVLDAMEQALSLWDQLGGANAVTTYFTLRLPSRTQARQGPGSPYLAFP